MMSSKKFNLSSVQTWRGENYRGYSFQLGNGKGYEISETDSYPGYARVRHKGEGICGYCGKNDQYLYCEELVASSILEELKKHPSIRIKLIFEHKKR